MSSVSMRPRSRDRDLGSRQERDRMRSGGPKLLCSPFFVTALFIVVVLLSMKYYSISTENDTLLLRIEVLQNQMKMTGSNLKSLDSSLSRKNEALLECNNDKIRAEEKSKKLEQDTDHKEDLISRLKDEINNKKSELEKLKTENVNLYMANDTISDSIKKLNVELEFLKSKNEKMELDLVECETLREKNLELEDQLNRAQEELVNFGAEKVDGKDSIAIHVTGNEGPHPQNLKDGQLPNVNPDAVVVRQPALQGNTYHQDSKGNYLPILPRGDPNKPRAKPRFSVADLKPEQVEDLHKDKRDNVADILVRNSTSTNVTSGNNTAAAASRISDIVRNKVEESSTNVTTNRTISGGANISDKKLAAKGGGKYCSFIRRTKFNEKDRLLEEKNSY